MKRLLTLGITGFCWMLFLSAILSARGGYHQFTEEYQEDEWYAYNVGVMIHTSISAEDFDELLQSGPEAFADKPTRRFGHDEANNAERVGFSSRPLASEPYVKVGENFGEAPNASHPRFGEQAVQIQHAHSHKKIETGRYKCTACNEIVNAKKRGGPTFADMSLRFKGANDKRSPQKVYFSHGAVANRN